MEYVQKRKSWNEILCFQIRGVSNTEDFYLIIGDYQPLLQEIPTKGITFALSKNPQSSENSPYVISVDTGNLTEIQINIQGLYRALPSSRKGDEEQCSMKSSAAECAATCRVNLIHSMCSCIPFSYGYAFTHMLSQWQAEYPNSSICTNENYVQCNLQYSGDDDNSCKYSCLPRGLLC